MEKPCSKLCAVRDLSTLLEWVVCNYPEIIFISQPFTIQATTSILDVLPSILSIQVPEDTL